MAENTNKKFISTDLTPAACCALPYNPSQHDAKRTALATRIEETLRQGSLTIKIEEAEYYDIDYKLHVLSPICRELNALGWVTRVGTIPEVKDGYYTGVDVIVLKLDILPV